MLLRCIIFGFYYLLPGLPLGQAPPIPPEKSSSTKLLETAALQIALDNEGFLPGVIDGKIGPKTELANKIANTAGRSILLPVKPWRTWKIPVDFFKDVMPLPTGWKARSALSNLTYETSLEKLAEYFHTSQEFLITLNPENFQKSINLEEGIFLKVPFLSPKQLPLAEHLQIELSDKVIIAYDDRGHILASFPCSIAAEKTKRPLGKLKVCVLAPNPDYLFDPTLFVEVAEAANIKSKLIIPPGPNNPVGEMWIGLNLKGYGIHGTPWPEEIGKTESHGCFRLSNWDIKRLANIVRIGTPVFIDE